MYVLHILNVLMWLLNNIAWTDKFWSFPACNFSYSSNTESFLGPNILLSTSVSNIQKWQTKFDTHIT
jgi:hypothetical protein